MTRHGEVATARQIAQRLAEKMSRLKSPDAAMAKLEQRAMDFEMLYYRLLGSHYPECPELTAMGNFLNPSSPRVQKWLGFERALLMKTLSPEDQDMLNRERLAFDYAEMRAREMGLIPRSA